MNAKSIAWALVTATAAVVSAGFVVPELGLAVASVVLGASALAASVIAKRPVARHSGMDRKEKRLEIA